MCTETKTALRIDQTVRSEDCPVVQEAPITFAVENIGTYTVMALPRDLRALALGFLCAEGLITGLEDVVTLQDCPDDPHVLRIRLTGAPSLSAGGQRNMTVVSACGLCGSQSTEEMIAALPVVSEAFCTTPVAIARAHQAMEKDQELYKATRGTHCAVLFDAEGQCQTRAEDVGRHNALDKAIGLALLTGRVPGGTGVALSGRVSLEMVVKCARAGIGLIAARSAATSLALAVAERCGIAVCTFVRGTQMTLWTHSGRLLMDGESQ